MTVYNDLRFLHEAVDSILEQEFRDLELIIVDDGTGNEALFGALERRDPRIRLVVNQANMGTAVAANRGIEAARADIIVRLDADDIAEPDRVGRLIAALEEDPQVGVVGSAVTLIDEAGQPHGVARMPETDMEVRWTILFHNPFYHSAVAFRRSCFEAAGRYLTEELVSQDHYLWFHMLPHCRARNLAQPLTRYRMNSRGLTASDASVGRNRTHRIREALWSSIGLTYDLYEDALARDISEFLRGHEIAFLDRRLRAYQKMFAVLGAFLDATQPHQRAGDERDAGQLAGTLVTRALANPPPGLRDTLILCRLCWPFLGPALAAAGARLARELAARVRAAGTKLTRSRKQCTTTTTAPQPPLALELRSDGIRVEGADPHSSTSPSAKSRGTPL